MYKYPCAKYYTVVCNINVQYLCIKLLVSIEKRNMMASHLRTLMEYIQQAISLLAVYLM